MTDWKDVYPLPWRVEGGYDISAKSEVIPFGLRGMPQVVCDAVNAAYTRPGIIQVIDTVDFREQRRFELFGRVLQGYAAHEGFAGHVDIDAARLLANAALEAFEQGENDGTDGT